MRGACGSWQAQSLLFFWLLKDSLFFNWRMIALQCWGGFCCTTTRTSYKYTCIPAFWAFLPSTTPPVYRSSKSPGWGSRASSSFPLAIHSTYGRVHVSKWLCHVWIWTAASALGEVMKTAAKSSWLSSLWPKGAMERVT